MKSFLARAMMVCAAALAVVFFAAGTAHAANSTVTLSGEGTMTHIDDGDQFRVCDTTANGHGVEGYLYDRHPSDSSKVLLGFESDGGDAGCDSFTYNVTQAHGAYYMVICPTVGSTCQYKAIFE